MLNPNKQESSPAKIFQTLKIKIFGKHFISESTCYENQKLAFRCHQLKNSKRDPFNLVLEQCGKH